MVVLDGIASAVAMPTFPSWESNCFLAEQNHVGILLASLTPRAAQNTGTLAEAKNLPPTIAGKAWLKDAQIKNIYIGNTMVVAEFLSAKNGSGRSKTFSLIWAKGRIA